MAPMPFSCLHGESHLHECESAKEISIQESRSGERAVLRQIRKVSLTLVLYTHNTICPLELMQSSRVCLPHVASPSFTPQAKVACTSSLPDPQVGDLTATVPTIRSSQLATPFRSPQFATSHPQRRAPERLIRTRRLHRPRKGTPPGVDRPLGGDSGRDTPTETGCTPCR
jgi:hypothetical protein